MHKYLRAIGFTKTPRRKDIQNIIREGVNSTTHRIYTSNENDDDSLLAQFDIPLGRDIGITVFGEFDEKDEYYPEYYFPYLDSDIISTSEAMTVEQWLDSDSYSGIPDDLKIGVTMIFRLRNSVEYIRCRQMKQNPTEGASAALSGLSLDGTIVLPIYKTQSDIRTHQNSESERLRLMTQARDGNEEAIHNLTIEEMDRYSAVISRIPEEDVFSIVDSYFMPSGSECDLYSVMGEIRECSTVRNDRTGDEIYVMTLDVNALPIRVCINREDLMGDPQVGRRFRGEIWLQGRIDFAADNG